MLSAVSNVVHVNVHLDEFLKCFIVQGQRQVRHRPCVIEKPVGDFAGKKGGPLEKNTDI